MDDLVLVSAFSLNMLPAEAQTANIRADRLALSDAQALAPRAAGKIGHPDTATLVQSLLGLEASPYAREDLQIRPGSRLLLAQYTGPRLAPGTTTLPEGAAIAWWLIALT